MTTFPNHSQVFAQNKITPFVQHPGIIKALSAIGIGALWPGIAWPSWGQKHYYLITLYGKLCPRPYRELELPDSKPNILSFWSETIPALK